LTGWATRPYKSDAQPAGDRILGPDSKIGIEVNWVSELVRARRLTDAEGKRLTEIVRRGRGNPVRVRRATMIMASASGTLVPAIAALTAADEDTVRDVIHAFNKRGLDALDPQSRFRE
jgi:hypothetical protein